MHSKRKWWYFKLSAFLLPIRHAHKSAESLFNRFVRLSLLTHVKSSELVKVLYEFLYCIMLRKKSAWTFKCVLVRIPLTKTKTLCFHEHVKYISLNVYINAVERKKKNIFYVPNVSSVSIGPPSQIKGALQLHFWAYIAVEWSENVFFLLYKYKQIVTAFSAFQSHLFYSFIPKLYLFQITRRNIGLY